jgi:membrane-associated PAP2 superfamily phosphatase
VVDPKEQETPGKSKKTGWLWPAGAMATGVAGVALLLLRGCWHRKMSWPVRAQGYAYQVCLGCGVKRLFDEAHFRSFGPFQYDLNDLIAWESSRKTEPRTAPEEQRPAS